MSTRDIAMPEMTVDDRRVYYARQALRRDGVNPAGLLELLAAIVADGTWERVTDQHGVPFAGRFREFVRVGLKFDPDELPKVISLRHPHEKVAKVAERMVRMRTAVMSMLGVVPCRACVGTGHVATGDGT